MKGVTNILLAIKPRWAERIYSGEKTVEVRVTVPLTYAKGAERDDLRILFYESTPVKRITGTAYSKGYRSMTSPGADLSGTCLNMSEFEAYSKGRRVFGIELEQVVRFDRPMEVSEAGVKAPMSFRTIPDDLADRLIAQGVSE